MFTFICLKLARNTTTYYSAPFLSFKKTVWMVYVLVMNFHRKARKGSNFLSFILCGENSLETSAQKYKYERDSLTLKHKITVFWLVYFTPTLTGRYNALLKKVQKRIIHKKTITDRRGRRFFYTFLYLLGSITIPWVSEFSLNKIEMIESPN